ncbi:hypothetical protein BaRGS_00027713 [Batillaria attramentaria]|uniref:Uncharacterized protein n=1 Tax=Batillaria attramentaria TaxID=370345 RepID=A0ABD0K1W0_9CAEN
MTPNSKGLMNLWTNDGIIGIRQQQQRERRLRVTLSLLNTTPRARTARVVRPILRDVRFALANRAGRNKASID